MMPTTSASDQIVYPGGLVVPEAAVALLNDLERRGFDIHIDTLDGAVVCRPGRQLTDDDKQAIRAFRDALKALIEYCGAVH